jgi:hypothetical protein
VARPRLASLGGTRQLVLGAAPRLHGSALPPHTRARRCGGAVRPVRGPSCHARLAQGARFWARRSTSHDPRRDGRLENRRSWSVHSRDRDGRAAGDRPGRPHDLRHTRLDTVDVGGRRRSCPARAWLGLDPRALGKRVRNRSSRSDPGLGARVAIDRSACLSHLARQRPLSARRGEARCETCRNRHPLAFERGDGRLAVSARRLTGT